MKLISKDKVLLLDQETNSIKVIDIDKERATKIVFDQIIKEKIKTIRPLNDNSLVLTTISNSIFLI